jgi:hypothetical protein
MTSDDEERVELLEEGDVLVTTSSGRPDYFKDMIAERRGDTFAKAVEVLLVEHGVTDYDRLKESSSGRFVIDPSYKDGVKGSRFVEENLRALMGRLNRERGHPRPPLLGCFQQGAK